MALLGHTAIIRVPCRDIQQSAQAWEAVGFEGVAAGEGITRLSDGQLLLDLVKQEFPFITICYCNAGTDHRVVNGPDDKELLSLQHVPRAQLQAPTKEQNGVLGYFESLAIGVPSARTARNWAEQHGYFVLEEFSGQHPQSDVTDGLLTLSFRENLSGRWLNYCTELDEDLYNDLTDATADHGNVDVKAYRNSNDNIDMIRIDMADGVRIVVTHDLQ